MKPGDIQKLATFTLALAIFALFPVMCHAANYTRHTFAADKVTFETKADKEEGIIAFATDELIIAHTQNTIKLKKYGKTAVMVLIRSVHHLTLMPWGDERDKKTEKKLMGEIRSILEKKIR